jgi:hypothetical protein
LAKKEARGSVDFLVLPSSAVGGSRTWVKYVNEWLRGREPPRGGRALFGEGKQSVKWAKVANDGQRLGRT